MKVRYCRHIGCDRGGGVLERKQMRDEQGDRTYVHGPMKPMFVKKNL